MEKQMLYIACFKTLKSILESLPAQQQSDSCRQAKQSKERMSKSCRAEANRFLYRIANNIRLSNATVRLNQENLPATEQY